MKKKILPVLLVVLFSVSFTQAQETEIKLTLSEQFFETLLSAVFENLETPKVPIAFLRDDVTNPRNERNADFSIRKVDYRVTNRNCDESVRLKKQMDGVMTAVRFRNGKIYAPIAFEGSYNPPLIGCIDFSGWAETRIDLSHDKKKNALIGKATVLNVNLSGTNGIGSSLITRLVQNSIDQKVNPLEIISLEKLSLTAPIQNAGSLKMKAVGIRHVVGNREINVFLKYRFEKEGK